MAEPRHLGTPNIGQMWEQAFPGVMEQAGQVRGALRSELRDCPVADETVLLLSELSANAIAHSASGNPGGEFTVRLQHFAGQYVGGEVEDEGSDWDGCLQDSARNASGLFLIVKLASAYGANRRTNGHRVVWFRLDYTAGDGRGLVPPPPARGPRCRR
jgi:anti-sigma regulatory factor (Ser/Thr protein kinase)